MKTRNQQIYQLRHEMTYRELAAKFHISTARVGQIIFHEREIARYRRLEQRRLLFEVSCEDELSEKELRRLAWWGSQFRIWLPLMQRTVE